ncbi:hypothetical protein IP84_08425 [beta proteobacterium AAP99]|nr:hypothetical protein IP84_08425 [beta proteobacterium AAP99]
MLSTTLAQHVLTAGIALALAYAVLVLAQRHNRAAHRWLALFLLCMACMGANESLAIGARADAALLRWQGFLAWSVVALAPALFMYIRHLLSAPVWPRWLVALHFAPTLVIGALLAAPSVMYPDPAVWRELFARTQPQGAAVPGGVSAALALQWAAYGVSAWLLLQTYRLRLLAQYSNIDQRRMGWLGALIACLPALLLLWLLARLGGPSVALLIDTLYVPVGVAVLATLALRQPAVLLEPIDPHPPAPSRPPPAPLRRLAGELAGELRAPTAAPPAPPPAVLAERSSSPLAHPPDTASTPERTSADRDNTRPAAGALAIAQPAGEAATTAQRLAQPEPQDPHVGAAAEDRLKEGLNEGLTESADGSASQTAAPEARTPDDVADAPSSSAEDEARWAALQARLDELLATERPYLDNDLSLAALAQMLQTSTHHLSYVLNQRLGQSFYDLINERRVREVQRCLRDPAYASQSILEIALDSGFSSKATFNAAFRKHAGTTPSAYRQQTAS